MNKNESNKMISSFKNILGYAASFTFLIGILIYIYYLILDKFEHDIHTTEEYLWIYSFLIILLTGFIVGYYILSSSIKKYI